MFCTNCGNRLVEGARFCSSCGMPLTGKMPLMQAGAQSSGQIKAAGEVIPPGYMNIGNPIRKPKVSAYTSLPRTRRMLPLMSIFKGHSKDDLILGIDQAYYWISGQVLYAMTEDCIMYRILSTDELQFLNIQVRDAGFGESVMDLINAEINIASGNYSYSADRPPESDNLQYSYFEYQHIKKIKPSPAGNSIKFAGMFGGNMDVPVKHFDFIYAYVSARI